MCAADHYLLNLSAKPSSVTCLTCPLGVDCAMGATVENITLKTGWWRLSNRTTDLYQCDYSGNASGCAGGDSVGRCANGFQSGPECKVCGQSGSYYDSGLCVECPPVGPRVVRSIGICIGILVVLGVLAVLAFAPSRAPPVMKPCASSLSRSVRDYYRFFKHLEMQPKLKVVVAFYQVINILNSSYSMSVPPRFTKRMDTLLHTYYLLLTTYYLLLTTYYSLLTTRLCLPGSLSGCPP
jgi:hypothetical protein